MTLFFPDLNIWLALSDAGHSHSRETWNWVELLSPDARLIFSRYTQIGLLRLLTNSAIMGPQTLTLRRAWEVYHAWLADPRVEFYPEPRGLEDAFRQATAPFASLPASKWVGDCYLLAYSRQTAAVLVTFDRALLNFARTQGFAALSPAGRKPKTR